MKSSLVSTVPQPVGITDWLQSAGVAARVESLLYKHNQPGESRNLLERGQPQCSSPHMRRMLKRRLLDKAVIFPLMGQEKYALQLDIKPLALSCGKQGSKADFHQKIYIIFSIKPWLSDILCKNVNRVGAEQDSVYKVRRCRM